MPISGDWRISSAPSLAATVSATSVPSRSDVVAPSSGDVGRREVRRR